MQLYAFTSAWEPAPRPTPEGITLLAVGDVHGCSAQLDALLSQLQPVIDDARDRQRTCELVMLGDYADRGPDSLGVLERLPDLADRTGIPVHLLRGNHDQFLIDHLRPMPPAGTLELWCENGGTTVLAEADMAWDEVAFMDPAAMAEQLRRRLGPELTALLQKLPAYWRCGSYLFVHGGVHPTRPLEDHSLDDLIWMREPFLDGAAWSHPFTVVHGHTPRGPEVFPHRIGVDSGCFFTGVLSAVELADDRIRFHNVTGDPERREFEWLVNPAQHRTFSTPASCTG
jgi:serine/threonine protein phosphatase 1